MLRQVNAKPEDVRRIRIKCRCGESSTFETVIQLANGVGFHPCPKCGRWFDITFRKGKWHIRPTPNQDGQMVYENGSTGPSKKKTTIN